jgi:hypothetical protein
MDSARIVTFPGPRSAGMGVFVRGAMLLLSVAVLSWGSSPALAQSGDAIQIASPADGDVLRGPFNVTGTVSGAAFLSAELAFAYDGDLTSTWFTISEILQPVRDAELAVWDTTAISDGEYVLRLRVSYADGTLEEMLVHVQVRNYTAPGVPTPEKLATSPPPLQVETPILVQASPTDTRIEPETPTALPPNSASLSVPEVLGGFSRGALAVLAFCLLVGVLLLRRRS